MGRRLLVLACFLTFIAPSSRAQVTSVLRIGDGEGGFGGTLGRDDAFASAVAAIGDLDGDGVDDLAVGAPLTEDALGWETGAVWILFMNADGTVRATQEIDESHGGFGGDLAPHDWFGSAIAAIGDLDSDGITELAVGARRDDTGRPDGGAVWILFMDSDGTVKSERRITEGQSGFHGGITNDAHFGSSLAAPGDIDGDGTPDVIVGAPSDDDGAGEQGGAFWTVFLEPDAAVKGWQKVSAAHGDLDLGDAKLFASDMDAIGDLDGNGVADLAVGAEGYVPANHFGTVFVLFMDSDGSVADQAAIRANTPELYACVGYRDLFALSVESLGDLDGNGVEDIAVGAPGAPSEGDLDVGGVFVLFLEADGTCSRFWDIGEARGGFPDPLLVRASFGSSLAALDLGGSAPRLAVGASGVFEEIVWLLSLDAGFPATDGSMGTPLCSPAAPNSTGSPGRMLVHGCESVERDCVKLTALDLPTSANIGYFLMGTGTNTFVPPGSAGPICVAPGIRRFLPPISNTTELGGGFYRSVGTSGSISGMITSGSTWGFQAWHRDGAGPSNLTDAVRVTFL